MTDEYNALIKNKTWTLGPRPTDTNIVCCMWLFHHKYLADGTLSRYKARLVANGSTQIEGIDVNETFSPVVKPGTIRMVLSLATSLHWPIHQLDVKNSFLHGDLAETIYMHQPSRLWDSAHPEYICLLQRQRIDISYLLLYVDDVVLTASFEILLQRIITSIHQEFSMTDLGDDGDPVCLHMHDPREPHLSALKRILRYVCGTLDYGLQLFSSSNTDLVAYSDAD
ncbi:ribonuclease H-like domain-containing protein [Tanacetum coccineum]